MSAPFFLSSSAGGERSARVDQPARAVWRSWVGGHTDHFLARGTQLCVLLWCLPEDLVQSSRDEDVHGSLLKRLWRRAGHSKSGARHRSSANYMVYKKITGKIVSCSPKIVYPGYLDIRTRSLTRYTSALWPRLGGTLVCGWAAHAHCLPTIAPWRVRSPPPRRGLTELRSTCAGYQDAGQECSGPEEGDTCGPPVHVSSGEQRGPTYGAGRKDGEDPAGDAQAARDRDGAPQPLASLFCTRQPLQQRRAPGILA